MKKIGKIKWYSKDKKFGFITSESNTDDNVFFRLENIIASEDLIDKNNTVQIIPSIEDSVEYEQYLYKGNKRAGKIVLKQRNKAFFKCKNCDMITSPKIIMNQEGKNKADKNLIHFPLRKVCPNCNYLIEEFKTNYDIIIKYNKAAALLLIYFTIVFFTKLFLLKLYIF